MLQLIRAFLRNKDRLEEAFALLLVDLLLSENLDLVLDLVSKPKQLNLGSTRIPPLLFSHLSRLSADLRGEGAGLLLVPLLLEGLNMARQFLLVTHAFQV